MVDFIVVVTENLGHAFVEIPVTPTPKGNGTFEVTLPLEAPQQFYAFKMQLH